MMEAEILFPIMDMVSSVTKSVKLSIGKTTMNVSIHEDNLGSSSAGENFASTIYTPKQILRNQDNLDP